MQLLKYLLTRLIGFCLIVYVLLLSYLYFNQESFIFQPSSLSADYQFKFDGSFEEINIPIDNQTNLNGLLFKANHSKGLIFYLHGNAGALDSWGNIAEVYTKIGYDCFIPDYRGYGKSGGKIDSEPQFLNDIDIAYQAMLKRYDEQKVVIIGYSIGTGPAAILTSKNHPKALVLQAPYFNLTKLADDRFPFVPHFLYKYKFATNEALVKITAPVYIFHGNKDQVIPYENSVQLQKLLKPLDLFTTLQGEDHIGINENPHFQSVLAQLLK